ISPGIITGCVLGGVVLFILIETFWKICRKRRSVQDLERHRREVDSESRINVYPAHGEIPIADKRGRVKSFFRGRLERQRLASDMGNDNVEADKGDSDAGHQGIGDSEEPESTSEGERSRELMIRERIRRHADSGWRPPAESAPEPLISGDGSIVDVPPTYAEAT
ncbi:hypothetical protein V5O48_013538, partial [Marasmius crinis-equi]